MALLVPTEAHRRKAGNGSGQPKGSACCCTRCCATQLCARQHALCAAPLPTSAVQESGDPTCTTAASKVLPASASPRAHLNPNLSLQGGRLHVFSKVLCVDVLIEDARTVGCVGHQLSVAGVQRNPAAQVGGGWAAGGAAVVQFEGGQGVQPAHRCSRWCGVA